KESLKARDFIHKGVISCAEEDFVKDIIQTMKKHEISQLPVMKDSMVIGVVSETRIIEFFLKTGDKELKVKEVMGDVPPIVSLNTEESVISNLLKFFSLVLVQDKGKFKGLITRSDILRKVYG
ncbi:CBS domain-containing protein, partial [Bacteroidota bacterium]